MIVVQKTRSIHVAPGFSFDRSVTSAVVDRRPVVYLPFVFLGSNHDSI